MLRILVVSYGTSYPGGVSSSIAIAGKIARSFPAYEVRHAYTGTAFRSQDGRFGAGSLEAALAQAAADGVTELVIQPTYITEGYAYGQLMEAARLWAGKFRKAVAGRPLLSSDSDFHAAVDAMMQKNAGYDDGRTAICYVGHGTLAASNCVYGRLQKMLAEAGGTDYYIGTLKAEPSLDSVVKAMSSHKEIQRVVLRPFLVSAGIHAAMDIAGDKEGSWKQALQCKGYGAVCVLEGIGQDGAIQDIYVRHVKEAIDSMADDVWQADASHFAL